VVGQQNADIADTLQLRNDSMATIFLACYIWGVHWRHPCAAAMRLYVKLL